MSEKSPELKQLLKLKPIFNRNKFQVNKSIRNYKRIYVDKRYDTNGKVYYYDKLKELSSVGYRQGTDYDIVSLKVLEDMLGGKKFAGGGMMNIDEMIRPIGMAGGGLPKEEQASASGTHPLVVFKEMYDQYRIDGVPIAGEKEPLSFKDFFEIIQIQLDNQASS